MGRHNGGANDGLAAGHARPPDRRGEPAARPKPVSRCYRVFTVSDNLYTGAQTTAEERQNAFTEMMELALPLADVTV